MNTDAKQRCAWAGTDPLMQAYHDEEWGVPQHDSRMLWEMLMLEGFQAGLSWSIILKRREGFRKAFKNFDPAKVAKFTERDIERLMQDEGIVRARAKIEATINGAKIYIAMQAAGEDFSQWIWALAGGSPSGIPAQFPSVPSFQVSGPPSSTPVAAYGIDNERLLARRELPLEEVSAYGFVELHQT